MGNSRYSIKLRLLLTVRLKCRANLPPRIEAETALESTCSTPLGSFDTYANPSLKSFLPVSTATRSESGWRCMCSPIMLFRLG
jgi:hypothetical protein